MTDKNTVNITISVTREERKAMKQIALDEDISVSALIRRWLTEYQKRLEANEIGKKRTAGAKTKISE